MNKLDMDTRLDYKIIQEFIKPNSSVLDLGCGDGSLLSLLISKNSCRGTGVEISEEAIYKCVANGISVSHGDIDTELSDYSDKSFDYVILNESLQQVLNPKKVILEAAKVGKRVIVGIPNFCHISARFQLFFKGKVPVTKELPYQWYDTPNLRFLSLKDFKHFCQKSGLRIIKQKGISGNRIISFKRNLLSTTGLFLLEKK